jgi:hypothetical protein
MPFGMEPIAGDIEAFHADVAVRVERMSTLRLVSIALASMPNKDQHDPLWTNLNDRHPKSASLFPEISWGLHRWAMDLPRARCHSTKADLQADPEIRP